MLNFDDLNEQQKEAVCWDKGSLLVLAGAGSGKTRVLTARLAWLLDNGACHPTQVLAVTFTNKAAREMTSRITEMMKNHSSFSLSHLWIGTFHGVCLRFLRIMHKEAGLSRAFQVLDAQDQIALAKRIIKEENKDPALYPPAQLVQFINHMKQKGLRCGSVPTEQYYAQKMISLYERYEQICNDELLVDFSELILRSYELLSQNEDVRKQYQKKFRHILVDEFQDTNDLQYAWLKVLSDISDPSFGGVFAVGDDDQSIYSFRGATVNNIRSFQSDFHVRKVIRLEQNYRSVSYILDAANELISKNSCRLGKNLWTDNQKKGAISVCSAANDYYEAMWIGEKIQEWLRQGKGSLSDIAVLYRTNAQSRCIEHVLFSAQIPFRVMGGARFFDRAEIRHVLAYLRLLVNEKDNTAFLRIINVPARGIGAQTVALLQKEATEQGLFLFEQAKQYEGKKRKPLDSFCSLMTSLFSALNSCESLVDCVSFVIRETQILSAFPASEQKERSDNLDQFLLTVETFEKEAIMSDSEQRTVSDLLSHFLLSVALESSESDKEATERVSLMTVHMSKGLEFRCVFVSGLEQGLFPGDRRDKDNDFHLEEERRLMYVAMTRAKDVLFLSFCRERRLYAQKEPTLCFPSQFIEEIPGVCFLEYPYALSKGVSHHRYKKNSPPEGFPKRSSSPLPYRVGQMVQHQHFGRGCITDIEGSCDDLYVRVRFEKLGSKLLSLKKACLEVLS